MALALHEQFLQTIERSSRPLIVLPAMANADDFATAFGVAALLQKLQKPIDLASSGGRIPKSIAFLAPDITVRGDLPNIRKMTITVDAEKAHVDELSYEVIDGKLQIHLLPKTGAWSSADVSVKTDAYRYDLIIAIGGSDLESFGALTKDYSDFFFGTPIINIDHHPKNEQFGAINIVDIHATSCAEVCHDLFLLIDPGLIDEHVATYFLTGMIHKTKSFRSANVTPKTLKTASELIARGARRDEIIQKLYKTRTVETLRLWGRALSRLKSDEAKGIVWTMLTRSDFAAAGCDEAALENIIDELLLSSPHARIAAVFYEHLDHDIRVILRAERPHDALALGAPFRASGTREEVLLHLSEQDIITAEKQVMSHLTKVITAA